MRNGSFVSKSSYKYMTMITQTSISCNYNRNIHGCKINENDSTVVSINIL